MSQKKSPFEKIKEISSKMTCKIKSLFQKSEKPAEIPSKQEIAEPVPKPEKPEILEKTDKTTESH